MRYRTLETQSQTFLYCDSFAPTCSSGEKSTWTLLLSPMPTTAPIYSAMEQPSEWVYYYQTTRRRMWWKVVVKMYPTSKLVHLPVHLQLHLQMSSRSCRDLRLKQYQENHPDPMQNESRTSHTSNTQYNWYTSTTWQLLSGPPHPPKLWLENRSNPQYRYLYLKILHIRHIKNPACMFTNPWVRSVTQENH